MTAVAQSHRVPRTPTQNRAKLPLACTSRLADRPHFPDLSVFPDRHLSHLLQILRSRTLKSKPQTFISVPRSPKLQVWIGIVVDQLCSENLREFASRRRSLQRSAALLRGADAASKLHWPSLCGGETGTVSQESDWIFSGGMPAATAPIVSLLDTTTTTTTTIKPNKGVELQAFQTVDLSSSPLPQQQLHRHYGHADVYTSVPVSQAGDEALQFPHSELELGTQGTNHERLSADERPLLNTGTPSSAGSGGHGGDGVELATADVGSAIFNLSTTIIGAGIMALPATMRVLGVPLGLFAILLMGLLSELSIEMLVHNLTLTKLWTFGDLVTEAMGWAAGTLAQICIIVNNGGVLIVYLIIMGDVLSGSDNHVGLLEGWTGASGWWNDRKLVVFLTIIVILAPLASLRKIDSLKFTSAASVALAVLFVVLASAIALAKLATGKLKTPRMLPSFASKPAILELLTVIPIMSNAFVCHFNVPVIYRELKERTPAKMFKVGRITALLCVLVYSATALSGYLMFGDFTNSDVLANFDTDLGIPFSRVLNDSIRIGYVLHLVFVFPVIHFSLRQTIDAMLFSQQSESKLRFAVLTFVLLALTFLGSTVIPNIWVAFQFTGATTGLSLGFIFPALVVIRSKFKRGKSAHESLSLAWAMVVMAVVISFIGIGTQIYSLVTHQGS